MTTDRWMTRDEAAAHLGLATKTLANMASAGIGPEYRRLSGGKRGGVVRYRRDWLDEWVMNYGTTPAAKNPRGRSPVIRG